MNDPFLEANKLMQSIRQTLRDIEPIKPGDYKLFDEYFTSERVLDRETHGNGFSYMLQMMNRIGEEGSAKLGFKFYDGDSLLPIVTYPSKEDPGKLSIYFLRPMGHKSIEKVIELSKQLRISGFRQPIYVKKIFPDQLELLLDNGFSRIEKLPWHRSAAQEDDTFPELLFDTKTLSAGAPSSRHYTNTYKSAKKLEKKHSVEVVEGNMEEAWSITNEFFQDLQKIRIGKLNLSEPQDYFNMIFHNPAREGLIRKVIKIDGIPVSYFIMERSPGSEVYNFYASLALRNKYKHIGDYTTVVALDSVAGHLVNMGGSEDQGIYDYKNKFGPYKKQQMHWAVMVD